MMEIEIPFSIIQGIGAESFKRATTSLPHIESHLTIRVDGSEAIPIFTQAKISLNGHSIEAESHGANAGGKYSIDGATEKLIESGESTLVGIYELEEEVGSFLVTGS